MFFIRRPSHSFASLVSAFYFGRRQENIFSGVQTNEELSEYMDPQDRIKARLMDAHDLDRTLNRMARQIVELMEPEKSGSEDVALIGMQTRGVFLARRLQEKIRSVERLSVPVGVLDATMYRDDFRLRLKQPVVRATNIPFDITERHLVLVDDVLFTGRTARAALDALMDQGRPASIRLLVIVDRGLRELPICADLVGRIVPTLAGEEVRVRLTEMDEQEGVWLVENPRAQGASRGIF